VAWNGGIAQWQDGDTTYLSVAFTYKLDEAYSMAQFAKACGQRVIAGGPAFALLSSRHELHDVAEVPTKKAIRRGKEVDVPADYSGPGEAITRHNPLATFASRGCSENCSFCIVPRLEGLFTLLPDFQVRPILCDNNLSGLDAKYQDYIIERYAAAGVKLKDANSGFEPHTFTEDIYRRWKPLINAGGGPWRFALDEMKEWDQALAVMLILRDEPQKRKRVYTMIGNEPFAECMARIQAVIDNGCEPHVQPYMKLGTLVQEPHIGHDWTLQKLQDVARWANGWVWKRAPFSEYDRHRKTANEPTYDAEQGLFL
jgi:hypothetical protein